MARGVQTANLMRHRARLSYPIGEGADGWGHPTERSYEPAVDVACYAWIRSRGGGSLEIVDGDKNATVTPLNLVLDRDTRIDYSTRIEGVYDRRGRVVYPGPWRVETVDRDAGHLRVTARRVAAGRA